MAADVVDLQDPEATDQALVGGKAAGLAALSRMDGVRVPPGFCVTTDAFARVVADLASVQDPLERLGRAAPGEFETLSAELREAVAAAPVPAALAAAITTALARLGAAGCAVRSSATGEDGTTASFAGQQDSYLNVVGATAVLEHVRRCWASLFTERAVAYRAQTGADPRAARMAVIVQELVPARSAGVLFTADPLSGHRRIAVIEAGFGLGEALVAGRVTPDVLRVRDGEVVSRAIAVQRVAIHPAAAGGTTDAAIAPERGERPALSDAQAVALARLGRQIAARLGRPQDIEWCLDDAGFAIVQSRPITTLFPLPDASDDEPHVYVSVGHQQMMTDPFKPLGLSAWQHTTPRPMAEAGGRLFVDVARELSAPASRTAVLGALGRSDPLIGDALQTILDRGDLLGPVTDEEPAEAPPNDAPTPIPTDPALVTELIERSDASMVVLERELAARSGPALLDYVVASFAERRPVMFDPRSRAVIMAGMEAAWWLDERLEAWLGERGAADVLTRSVPGNVTSEMGLALLDVADVVRPHPAVVAFLEQVEQHGFDDECFLDALATRAGGPQARDALAAFLERHGMRCPGEIDLTRPRWAERPTALVPALLGDVRSFDAPGAGRRRFEQGRREAEAKREEVLARLRALEDDGPAKAAEAARMIDRLRTFAGYREHPKYAMVTRYLLYKRALLGEADRLVADGVLEDREDIFFLRLEELGEVVRTRRADPQLLRERRAAFDGYGALRPPRVFTSEGEVVQGSYRRDDLPDGALAGLAVSPGVVEGRARVVLDPARADLEPGDILVTAFTDPSWTPLFVRVAGLVTEVGGLMTHGAVVAREYGLPAVVGVPEATRRIRDGRRIRVHATDGYVELLA